MLLNNSNSLYTNMIYDLSIYSLTTVQPKYIHRVFKYFTHIKITKGNRSKLDFNKNYLVEDKLIAIK